MGAVNARASLPLLGAAQVAVLTQPAFNRLRQGLAKALAGNPLTLPPWTADTAWAAATAYAVAQVRSSAGQRYVCIGAGTSHATTGPSATTYGDIADNTALWAWVGAAATTTDAQAPTVTRDGTDRSATYTKAYLTSVNGGSADGDNAFNFVSGIPVARFGNVSFWAKDSQPGAGNLTGTLSGEFAVQIELCTDAQDLVVELHQTTTGNARLILDGRYFNMSMEPGVATRTALLIQFNEWRPHHTIAIESDSNFNFKKVMVKPASSVWAPPRIGPSLYLLGNSFISGGDVSPTYQVPSTILRHRLGAHRLVSGAIGGTGFDTASTARKWIDRIPEIVQHAPDAIIVQSSFFTDSGATLKATTRAYIAALRAQPTLAAVPVFAIGSFASRTGPSVAAIDNENAFFEAITESGDPLIYTIPNSTAKPESWVRGTGRVGATTGSGNADVYISDDGTHQSVQGYVYYAHKIADAVAARVDSLY